MIEAFLEEFYEYVLAKMFYEVKAVELNLGYASLTLPMVPLLANAWYSGYFFF